MFWTLARALGLTHGRARDCHRRRRARHARGLRSAGARCPGPAARLADRAAAHAASALPVTDALTAALADGRAHEPDAYAVLVATFHERPAADSVVAELTAAGYRAHWAEVRSDADAQQQVFVTGYGTLEDALGAVTRLRQRPAAAGGAAVPGAGRRPASPAPAGSSRR